MRFQKQAYRHRPEEGVYGDCDRTAWAVLLNLDRDELPHWGHDGPPSPVFQSRRKETLARHGVAEISVAFPGATPLKEVLGTLSVLNPGQPFLLGCTSKNGVGHTVVCLDGEVVCDPSLDDSGVAGPMEDGFWWVTYPGRLANSGSIDLALEEATKAMPGWRFCLYTDGGGRGPSAVAFSELHKPIEARASTLALAVIGVLAKFKAEVSA